MSDSLDPLPEVAGWVSGRATRLASQAREGALLMARAAWRGVVEVAFHSDDLTHAASVAYYALLSFFPFVLLLLSVMGFVTGAEDAHSPILGFIRAYFPNHLAFADTQLEYLRNARFKFGVGGALALVWASNGVFGAISTAVNHAWAVEQPRSFWGHRLFSFLMMLAAGVVLVAGLGLFSVAKANTTIWFGQMAGRHPWIVPLSAWGERTGGFLLFVVVVGLIFYFVPNTKVRLRDVWPGAVLTALAWRVALEGFSWYVRDPTRFSVHGSIATVVVFLVWVYISSVILLYGVEYTASYARMRRERHAPAGSSPVFDPPEA
ncbi:MAG: YihY/virulence factor BrkB family protein [Acidobacteriota bacterium]